MLELFFNSRAAVLCSEIVPAFAAEVSGGLQMCLLERLEGFKSFSASLLDRRDSLRLCSMMPVCCPAVAMPAC